MSFSKQKPKRERTPGFKSVFIVDPIKGERLHLAKLLKQEKLLMMTFERLEDCLKQNNSIRPDLVVYVLRKDKNEPNQLKKVKKCENFCKFVEKSLPCLAQPIRAKPISL